MNRMTVRYTLNVFFELRVFLILVISVVSLGASAQSDPAYSQYTVNPLAINPGYAGSKDAITIAFTQRSQWVGIDTRVSTASFSFQTPISYSKSSYGGFAQGRTSGANFGMGVVLDQVGALKQTVYNVDYSYLISLSEEVRLGMGVRLGYKQYSFDLSGLSWKDPGDPLLNEGRINTGNANVGLGFYLFKPNVWYVGLSAPQMFHVGNVLHQDTKTQLNIQEVTYLYASGGGVISVSRDVKLRPSGLIRVSDQNIFSVESSLHVILNDKLWLGAGYRLGDALIGSVMYDVLPNLRVAYSYEFGLSSMRYFHAGTHEITIVWNLFPVSYKKRFHCYL